MHLAGNDDLAIDEATGGDATTTPLQVNAAQVRVARQTLICSMSLQPSAVGASSPPINIPPTT